jgi:hypothetical protein
MQMLAMTACINHVQPTSCSRPWQHPWYTDALVQRQTIVVQSRHRSWCNVHSHAMMLEFSSDISLLYKGGRIEHWKGLIVAVLKLEAQKPPPATWRKKHTCGLAYYWSRINCLIVFFTFPRFAQNYV